MSGSIFLSERVFDVVVRQDRVKNLIYPNLTAKKAVELMNSLTARGRKMIARTRANGITEDLTLSEMNEVYEGWL
jgi:hypothetical protein